MQRHTACLPSHDLHTSPGQAHHMRRGVGWGGGASSARRATLERHGEWRPRNHTAELSMYYVAARETDQLLREDTFDMI